ncbi:FirrV-1-B8 [Feldmannia irregularis virus a]|uniref:FirrV-1-B8 n=1 Tax=Feldmannia irregularis virus a TaxID=231992 RepID=Q6XM28_9PHYC|nr:FirrV-1-B8 [Feldmannia irregularis virus a]AAR26883.1 FirrV-1-B8 [Feldmannia irregularis virus a]
MVNITYHGVTFVVARYKENVEWVRPLVRIFPGTKCFVYNKGTPIDLRDNDITVRQLPNVGRESHTYLTHLLTTAKDADNRVCCVFLQGHPFDHVGTFTQLVRKIRQAILRIAVLGSEFENVGTRLIRIRDFNTTFHPGLKPELIATFHDLFGDKAQRPHELIFSAGAMFAVSGTVLKPSAFYVKILDWVDKERDPRRGYCLERLWSCIFSSYIYC